MLAKAQSVMTEMQTDPKGVFKKTIRNMVVYKERYKMTDQEIISFFQELIDGLKASG